LVQLDNGKKLPLSGWTCDECGGDATTNLWLNLTDGHVGCGRQNWDGTGGKGHALEHYKTTGFPLVVKLGTITGEGKAGKYLQASIY
jgi:ubiquitin carboxyl-terminal hydrolase 5/13